jgi:signal peptidase II
VRRLQERRSVTALNDVVRPTGRSRSRRRSAVIVAVAGAVVVLDQLTKTWALHHLRDGPHHVIWTLRLNLTFNTGVAFSEARGSTPVVTVIALVVVALLLVIARRTSGTLTAIILGLIIGGALGNLVDRLIRHHAGGVIDFIDFQWWPVFNVADAAITVGVVMAVIRSIAGSAAPSQRGAPPGAG